LIAAEGGAVAICSPRDEVEVCVGNIEPYLDAVAGVSGITVISQRGLQVVSYPLVGGYRLVATADVDSLGNVVGACHTCYPELESILNPDDPDDDPAVAAAIKVKRGGAA